MRAADGQRDERTQQDEIGEMKPAVPHLKFQERDEKKEAGNDQARIYPQVRRFSKMPEAQRQGHSDPEHVKRSAGVIIVKHKFLVKANRRRRVSSLRIIDRSSGPAVNGKSKPVERDGDRSESAIVLKREVAYQVGSKGCGRHPAVSCDVVNLFGPERRSEEGLVPDKVGSVQEEERGAKTTRCLELHDPWDGLASEPEGTGKKQRRCIDVSRAFGQCPETTCDATSGHRPDPPGFQCGGQSKRKRAAHPEYGEIICLWCQCLHHSHGEIGRAHV